MRSVTNRSHGLHLSFVFQGALFGIQELVGFKNGLLGSFLFFSTVISHSLKFVRRALFCVILLVFLFRGIKLLRVCFSASSLDRLSLIFFCQAFVLTN